MCTSIYIYSFPGFTKDSTEAVSTIVSLSSPQVTLLLRCVLLWFMLPYERQLPPHSAAFKTEWKFQDLIYLLFILYPL